VIVLGRDTQGHVARSLLPRAPCAVAVTPPASSSRDPSSSLRRIGIALNDSPEAQVALVVATELAQASDAQLVRLVAGQQAAGDAADALTQASAGLDLLVCGTRGRGRATAAIFGSVSTQLAAHARCPVLVVPPAGWPRSAGAAGVSAQASV